MNKSSTKHKRASNSKGGYQSKSISYLKKSSVCYFTSNNQFNEASNIQLNMKPIQTSFTNNSHFNSLILQTHINDCGVQVYQSIINKLFKFLKKKLPVDVYNDIKSFFKSEVITTSTLLANDSVSSIFDVQGVSRRSEGKKLKLSYDLCNNNSKAKAIKVDMSHLKKCGKELHSLYSIIKGNHKMITKNLKPSNTQSQSKSKSRSTSRECSSNQTHHQIIQSQKTSNPVKVKHSLINKSQPLLNGKLISKINLRVQSQIKYPPTRIPNRHSTEGKIKTTPAPLRQAQGSNPYRQQQQVFHSKTATPVTNYHHNTESNQSKHISALQFQGKHLALIDPSPRIRTQIKSLTIDKAAKVAKTEQESNSKTNSNRNQIETECIESTSNGTKPGQAKNEELMKAIKSTLDDNLRIMFNFSYENFLSKESESESKNNSLQELSSTEQNEVHYHTTTNRKR